MPDVFPGGSDGKESACSAGDPGLIPGLRRSPGERKGDPPQYSCLEKTMDREARQATVHGVAKSWTRLKRLSTHKYCHSFPSKKQVSFNFIAASTFHSDFGSQENKICQCFHFFPFYMCMKGKVLAAQIRSDQSLSRVRLFATPWIAACILFNVSLCVFVFFMDFMYLCVLYVFYVSVCIFFYMCIHLLIFYFLLTGNRTAIWPTNPTAGHTHWGNQNWKSHMYPNVHCSTVYNS